MNEFDVVRGMVLRASRGVPASAPIAKAILEWARPHAAWLLGSAPRRKNEPGWQTLLAGLEAAPARDDAPADAMVVADALARMIELDAIDAALLSVMVACDRLPRVASLSGILSRHGHSLPAMLGELAGAEANDADRIVRRSAVLRLGLVSFYANRQGEVSVDVQWALERLLDRSPTSGPEMIDALVGPRQPATLALDDFAHIADADFLVRLLLGAAREGADGVNILIHGPPGTGKTEFARTIVAAAGAALHGVGEVCEDGEEPTRWDRLTALQLAERLLGPRGGAVLLFDEMEDLIGEAQRSSGDWYSRREGSKIFVNRMLETNKVPVIWTTNAVGNIDPAILRRMSFVLKVGVPPRSAALRMLDRVARDEGVEPAPEFGRLLERAPEATTVLRMAARAARLAGEADGGVRTAGALVKALRGADLPPDRSDTLDLDLFETDRPLSPLLDRLRESGATDVSLLLTGPPGTGKTALAHHVARALDRPLLVKRASDLLSKWVGETEAQIADAFAEARRRESVLLFDEADSLLFDRATARNSWEVGQVNELLTWLDRHPLPVVAATNHAARLDPATLRRFVFKIDMRPLGPMRAAQAFERFFGMAAPAELAALANLTPGDFAVVARQLRHQPARDAGEILDRLREEAAAKSGATGRMGF